MLYDDASGLRSRVQALVLGLRFIGFQNSTCRHSTKFLEVGLLFPPLGGVCSGVPIVLVFTP